MAPLLSHPAAVAAPTLARSTALAAVLAPPLWFAAWMVMRVEGHVGPGWGWTIAHLLWVTAYALFAAAAVGIHRRSAGGGRAPKAVGAVGLTLSLAGAAALLAQMAIDLYVGFRAGTDAGMSAAYEPFLQVPWIDVALFQVGPSLLFVGLMVLAAVGAWRGWAPVRAAVLTAVGVVVLGAGRLLPDGLAVVEAVGVLVLWAGLVTLAAGRRR